jgi:hypothetical protein
MKHLTATIIRIMLLVVVLTGLTGCIFSTPKTPASVISKTLNALSQVKSYQLDTDFNDKFASIEFKGTKVIDVSNKEMGMNISITMGTFLTNDERYFIGGIDYSESVSEENSPKTIGWTKRKLDDTIWNQQTQLPMLLELLNSASRISSQETAQLNDVDCYVLTITPSAQAATDFVLSQDEPGGSSIGLWMLGGGVSERTDMYNFGAVELWINKANYLPLKVTVNLDFRGHLNPENPDIFEQGYHDELDFSNYNQPVTIQLPPDALNAQNVGN